MAFLDEIASWLVSNGIAQLNVTLFLSSKSSTPVGSSATLTLTDTGGTAQMRIHNVQRAYERPSMQVVARAATYPDAYILAKTAHSALDGVDNITINGVPYLKITARQEPTDIGLDSKGRAQSAFNIDALKVPS